MIDPVDSDWLHYDGGREKLKGLSLEAVQDGCTLYVEMANRANTRSKDKEEAALAVLSLKNVAVSEKEVNVSDLNQAARTNPKFWYGQSVICLEFELTGEERYVGKLILFSR